MDTESKHFDASKYLDAADGGLAFPCENIAQFGLTQRDYFAAAALTGLLAADNRDEWTPKDTATFAYVVADAMLQARRDGPPLEDSKT